MGCKYLTDGQVGARRRATSCVAKGSVPVAGAAKKGTPKNHAKLQSRMEDYSRMMGDASSRAYKAPQGTFHKPGSYQ